MIKEWELEKTNLYTYKQLDFKEVLTVRQQYAYYYNAHVIMICFSWEKRQSDTTFSAGVNVNTDKKLNKQVLGFFCTSKQENKMFTCFNKQKQEEDYSMYGHEI